MTVHAAVPARQMPRTTTTHASAPVAPPVRSQPPPPPPGIAYGDAFTPAGPRCVTPDATIMPITTPDSAKATSVLRFEARQCRIELVSAAMRGDRRATMELGQRLGQLKEALSARGASMFPSNELSLSQYRDSFQSMSDEQMLGERSDQLQVLLVGDLQFDRGAVENARERFGAVQTEIDSRGGCGMNGLDAVFAGWGDGQLTSAVTGMVDAAAGSGANSGAPTNVHAAEPVGGPGSGGQGGLDLGGMLGSLFGGIFGGGQGGQGGGIGDVLMGFLDPLGLFKGLTGGAQGGQQAGGGGGDRLFNGAMSGLMEMATRGLAGPFQELLGGLFK